jgi:hypothetical protein
VVIQDPSFLLSYGFTISTSGFQGYSEIFSNPDGRGKIRRTMHVRYGPMLDRISISYTKGGWAMPSSHAQEQEVPRRTQGWWIAINPCNKSKCLSIIDITYTSILQVMCSQEGKWVGYGSEQTTLTHNSTDESNEKQYWAKETRPKGY